MEAIIDGKKYNTETARKLCNDSYSYKGDFHYYDEDLYVTKKGNFFIAGEGGPMSKYSKCTGQNERSGSSGIVVVTRDQAFDFCQKVGAWDVCEELFSDFIEEA